MTGNQIQALFTWWNRQRRMSKGCGSTGSLSWLNFGSRTRCSLSLFFGRARRSRDGPVKSRTCRRGPPPPPLTDTPLGWPPWPGITLSRESTTCWRDGWQGALSLYSDAAYVLHTVPLGTCCFCLTGRSKESEIWPAFFFLPFLE